MVHDPRVTSLLSRLGGLYRDPARVDRDAASLLKSSIGAHLTPGIATLVETDHNRQTANCLVLQGTIPIVFRGNTYQQLVDIFLPPGYPNRPPVSFVRLAPNMYLKEHHKYVGVDGMVYMPYLHEWNPRTHSLIEMVVAMSSVFSADPPVFSRPPPPPPPANDPPPPAYSDSIFASSTPPPSSIAATSTNEGPSKDSERYIQEQLQAIVAKEAEEANLAAEAARKAAQEDEERNRQIAAQKQWEEQKRRQLQDKVNEKMVAYLTDYSKRIRTSMENDLYDKQKLDASDKAIKDEIERLEESKKKLGEYIQTVKEKTEEIEAWLEEAKSAKDEDTNLSVDNLVQPRSRLHEQMLDLAAENASLTDALYFLDRGLYMGQLDCTTHQKTVRRLAKRQFLVKAHLIKINQVLLDKGAR